MPRKLKSTLTLDALEDEILYTDATLHTDPNATAHANRADTWLSRLDTVRTIDRELRKAMATADAARVVANGGLDSACTDFGDDLWRAVNKDRGAKRWLSFFPVAVSAFVRQPFADQTRAVRSWLTSFTDPVLDAHREVLSSKALAAEAAIQVTDALVARRASLWMAREEMSAWLTAERDALRDDLARHAREQGLPRAWPDSFFRVEQRSSSVPMMPETKL